MEQHSVFPEDLILYNKSLNVPPQLERHGALLVHGVGQLPEHDPLVKGRLGPAWRFGMEVWGAILV